MKARAHSQAARTAGFSLTELMVAVGLLSVIVFALYAMFNQTQKAFRQSLSQVDVTEGSRSALELIAADIEKASSLEVDGAISLVIRPAPPLLAYPVGGRLSLPGPSGVPHPLPLDEIFFMYRNSSNSWQTAGFFLGDPDNPPANAALDGVVGLYKFDDGFLTNTLADRAQYGDRPFNGRGHPLAIAPLLDKRFTAITDQRTTTAFPMFSRAPRIVDGVVFFRLTALDREGRPYVIDQSGSSLTPYSYPPILTNLATYHRYITNLAPIYLGPSWPYGDKGVPGESAVVFRGTNFPAAIDIELGVLDTKTMERFRGLPQVPTTARQRFLENNAAQIVTLRHRVNLRTAPFLTP
jgi:prepilin-type N-terminal cleavage/methylation domain-containing protein